MIPEYYAKRLMAAWNAFLAAVGLPSQETFPESYALLETNQHGTFIAKPILYFGKPAIIACDFQCDKAWGINNRPKIQLSDDEEDTEYLADGELDTAPLDPGTYEGWDAKPVTPEERLNRWCCRECERCAFISPGEALTLKDFSKRRQNKRKGS